MAEDKKSFVLYSDLISIVEKLITKDRENKTNYSGELFFHILQYVNDKQPIPIDFIVEMAFEPVKLQLKRDLEKYEVVKKRRSEAGKQGGRPKKEDSEDNEEKAKKANALFEKQSKAKKAVNVNVSVNGNVNGNVNDILLKKETKEGEILKSIQTPDKVPKKFRIPSVQEVQEYCKERNNTVSAFSFVNFYQSKDWMVGKNKMKDWKAAVRTWEDKRISENQNKHNGNQQFTTPVKKPYKFDVDRVIETITRDSQ